MERSIRNIRKLNGFNEEAFVKDHKSSYKNEVRFQDNELPSIVCLDESDLN